jgi:hypothetical protein
MLSLKTQDFWENLQPASTIVLDLMNSELMIDSSDSLSQEHHSIQLDDLPILLFLKGMGCLSVRISTHDKDIIQRWTGRIQTYEQLYLSDPDSLKINECHWDEFPSHGDVPVITVKFHSTPHKETTQSWWVPPMLAPLGISESTRLQFLSEVEDQSPNSILNRFSSILEEYKKSSAQLDAVVWAFLLSDSIAIALEAKQLDVALEFCQSNTGALRPVWSHSSRVIRMLKAYDPKAAETIKWAQLFETFSNTQLVELLEEIVPSEAGPQSLKLLTLRAQQSPEELANLAFHAKPFHQRLLLPRISHHWKPFHYGQVLQALETSLAERTFEDLSRLWVSALVRSSRRHAFEDIEKIFRPRFFGFLGSRISQEAQKIILQALAEIPSTECYEFLKRIRRHVQGELADVVEKILKGYTESFS